MNLSKKQFLAIISIVLLLTISTIALAVLYMTKDVEITGGVSVIGEIEVYDEDGETALESFTFENFTGGSEETKSKIFFINNTGNQPVYVYWNISASSITWHKTPTEVENHYLHMEPDPGPTKYHFSIYNATDSFWDPDAEGYQIAVGEGAQFRFELWYTSLVNTAEKFTLTTSFYAEDA